MDKLNGYSFEAIHLVCRVTYLGLAGKVDQAMDSLTQGKMKALAVRDEYSLMAENAYASGLVQKGRADLGFVANMAFIIRSTTISAG
jgi:hypothetical protein